MSVLRPFLYVATKPFRWHIFCLLGTSLGWALIITAQPYLIKRIIDTVTKAPPQDLFGALIWIVVLYLLLGLGLAVLNFLYDTVSRAFFPAQRRMITHQLMEKMFDRPISFYKNQFAGNLTNKINDVVLYTPDLIEIFLDNFVTCFFTLVFVLYNVAMIHPKFAWALVIWLSIFLGGSLGLLFTKSYLAYRAAETRSSVMGQIVDVFSNISSVWLFFRQKHELKYLNETSERAADRERQRDGFFMMLRMFQGVSFTVFEVFCFWWLLKGLCNNTITPGGFVLVLTLNLQVLDQFWSLGSEIREFWGKLGALQQALQTIYFAEPDSILEADNAPDLVVHKGRIRFQNVDFSYGKSPFFVEKSVSILGQQKVGLVGFSGSGKSTFVHLILRLYDVTKGTILIDDQDIRQVSLKSLRRNISVIPQDCILFNRSIKDNILYGKTDASFQEVIEAAQKAQVHDVIEKMPQGYDTLAGERGMRLSGGQRQRIVIARAIIKNAPILIFDEPTSSMDGLTEEELHQAFREIMERKTVLFIAHRLKTLVDMDRILVFQNGQIVQDGPHDDLIQSDNLYRRLWNAQKLI